VGDGQVAAKSSIMMGKRAAEWGVGQQGAAKLHKPLQDNTNRVPLKAAGPQLGCKPVQPSAADCADRSAQQTAGQQAAARDAGNNVAVERSSAGGSTSTAQKVRCMEAAEGLGGAGRAASRGVGRAARRTLHCWHPDQRQTRPPAAPRCRRRCGAWTTLTLGGRWAGASLAACTWPRRGKVDMSWR
jgi:hypothetical protein